MTEARKKLDAAMSELIDQYEVEAVEPEPPARKIDDRAFADWKINTVGRVIDIDSWYVNGFDDGLMVDIPYREMQSKLIVVAPDLMRDVIKFVNEWNSKYSFTAPAWLNDMVIGLRERVIAAGFECDLE